MTQKLAIVMCCVVGCTHEASEYSSISDQAFTDSRIERIAAAYGDLCVDPLEFQDTYVRYLDFFESSGTTEDAAAFVRRDCLQEKLLQIQTTPLSERAELFQADGVLAVLLPLDQQASIAARRFRRGDPVSRAEVRRLAKQLERIESRIPTTNAPIWYSIQLMWSESELDCAYVLSGGKARAVSLRLGSLLRSNE